MSGRWKRFCHLREYHPWDILNADERVAFQPVPEKISFQRCSHGDKRSRDGITLLV